MARPDAVDLRERMVRRIDVNLSAKRALSVSCAVKLIHIPIGCSAAAAES